MKAVLTPIAVIIVFGGFAVFLKAMFAGLKPKRDVRTIKHARPPKGPRPVFTAEELDYMHQHAVKPEK